MFDVSWGELLVIGMVALIVIGPRELPGLLRNLGRGASKLRMMAGEFRSQFDDAMREAELHEVKKDFTDATSGASSFNPLETIRSEIKGAVDAVKGEAASSSGMAQASQNLAAIEADAKALEAEIRIGASDFPPPVEAPVFAEPTSELAKPEAVKPARKRKPKTEAGDA